MLECRGVNVAYGQLEALRDVSVSIPNGEVVSIVGANGAGKTTLLRAISGLQRCRRGSIRLDDIEITNRDPASIVRQGISHVPAGRQLFNNLSVLENLRLGAYSRMDTGGERRAQGDELERTMQMFPLFEARLGQAAGTLSGGEQQMLAIARALMARPRVLLLDEPSLGLAPKIVEGILSVLNQLKEQEGLTMLLVEQNAHLALDFASRAYVLDTGRVVEEGATDELRRGDRVARIYLGVG